MNIQLSAIFIRQEPKIEESNKAGIMNLEVILVIMLNEGCRLLEEGIVSDYEIIDKF